MRTWLCCLLLLQAVAATAQEQAPPPVIREIVFSGNDTTQPKTMLREMSVRVGDVADPAQIEHSRQAVQDLGLFKSVSVRQEPLPDGVRLIYEVREKFYFLPYPRLNANADQQYSYGAELRWNNIRGLNQNLQLLVTQGDSKREGYGKQTSYTVAYVAPFIWDSSNNLALSANHLTAPRSNLVTGDPYTEKLDSAQVLLSHRYSTTAASQGWLLGGGLQFQNEDRYGLGAAPPYGHATSLVGVVEYRDLHDEIYSELGELFSFRQETALRGVASDYGYTLLTAGYDRYFQLGDLQHQTLQLSGDIGGYFNVPQDVTHFAQGGTGNLRGFPKYSFEGNSFYYGTALYQRPIGWNWLRVMGGVEIGNVAAHPSRELFRHLHADAFLGLRIRFAWFVNLQFEAGYAMPLNGGDTGRLFGGRL